MSKNIDWGAKEYGDTEAKATALQESGIYQGSKPRPKLAVVPDALPTKTKPKESRPRLIAGKDISEAMHLDVPEYEGEVDGEALIKAICEVISRYVTLPRGVPKVSKVGLKNDTKDESPYALWAVSLWVIMAWTFGSWKIAPYLTVMSPEPGCGKSTLLSVLAFLCPKANPSGSITASAIFREIDAAYPDVPTLLLDEADAQGTKENEELRSILNSGWMKAVAIKQLTDGEGANRKTRRFSTWAPKVFATIRKIAGTLMDRSVIVRLQRQTPEEEAAREDFDFEDTEELKRIRAHANAWAAENEYALLKARPDMPKELSNRPKANWRNQIAIADAISPDWGTRARNAARALSGGTPSTTAGVLLLWDIYRIFVETYPIKHAREESYFTSTVLIERLCDLEESPWKEFRRDRDPINGKLLKAILETFDIAPHRINVGSAYYFRDFESAWDSYGTEHPDKGAECAMSAIDEGNQ